MKTWFVLMWERIRGGLWFLPALMSAAAAALAIVCARLDQAAISRGAIREFLYRGEPESARALLSTLAGSMITVAGVSFSVTMVALSLTSSQFGPRLLVNFMRDRGNQVVLGAFIGTFVFCLVALGSPASGGEPYVSVSASVALVLSGVSLMLLIYFIHHVASSMQADHVIDGVALDLRHSLERIFPAGESPRSAPDRPRASATVAAPAAGYLQGVDDASLVGIAAEHDLRLRVLRRPGHFVVAGAPLVEVTGEVSADDAARRIRSAFIVGGWRTADQDPEYGIHQLVEIAVRALSPGVNDPFTAITCVDRLAGVLATVAARPARPPVLWDDDGEPRVWLDPIDFAGVLDAAFDQIRQCARTSPAVAIRLLEALAHIGRATDDDGRRDTLRVQARLIMDGCDERWLDHDREALDERFRLFTAVLDEAPPSEA